LNGSASELGLEIACHHCEQSFVFLLHQDAMTCPHCGQQVTRQEAIQSFLRTVMAATFAYDRRNITSSSRLNEIGDSMGTIELLMKLENEFGISIDHDDIEELESVGDVTRYVDQKVAVAIRS